MEDTKFEGEKKCFVVKVTWHYNVPDMPHTRTFEICALSRLDAKNKIYSKYPNIQELDIQEIL